MFLKRLKSSRGKDGSGELHLMSPEQYHKGPDVAGVQRILLSKSSIEDLRRSVADLVLGDLKKMEAERLRRRSVSMVKEFADKVPVMGLSDAIKSKRRTPRICWSIIFFGCMLAAAYFVFRVFEEYNTDPTATKVNLARLSSFSFPQLILCLDTWLNAEKALRMGLTKEAIHYGLSYLIAVPDLFEQIARQSNSSTAQTEFEDVYRRYNFSNLIKFYEEISLDAVENSTRDDEISYSCYGCMDRKLPKMVIDYDVCYKIRLFDVDGKLRQSYGWYRFIIRVPDLSQGMTRQRTYWRLYTYLNPALKKLVAASPFVSVSRGHTHTIRIASESFNMISKPTEPCIDKTEFPKYSAVSCAIDCISQDVKRYSNCTVFNFDRSFRKDLTEYCNTYTMDDDWGIKQGQNETLNDKRRDGIMNCSAGCLPECNVWRYHNDVDTHVSGQLRREAAAWARQGRVKRNVSAAKMYFINADVLAGGILRFVEVHTYSFETLLGNIGGTCGIWIGVSILTVVKLFSFCSKQCVLRARHCCMTKPMKKSPEPVAV